MDLHIHTCLSPCSEEEMLPSAIIEQAKRRGLDGIGICDHNSAENVLVVKKVGKRAGFPVLGGMEITSCEEVHIMALFDDDAALIKMQGIVYKNLSGENDALYFGEQQVVDECNAVTGTNTRLLIGATSLDVEEVVAYIHALGGIAIASHVDREAYSIFSQLGFIPPELELDGLEVSSRSSAGLVLKKFPQAAAYPIVTFSDAHFLDGIGKTATSFLIKEATVGEISKALRHSDGRRIN